MSDQLSLFNEPQFDDRIRRVEINGTVYFSVLDVFTHYGKAKNVRQAWKTAQGNLDEQGFASSPHFGQLRSYQFAGERQRETPIATLRVCDLIGIDRVTGKPVSR